MKELTLLYLMKEDTDSLEVLLAEKKYGAAKGIWNGIGGKFDGEKDKTIEDTLRRETQEEIGVEVGTFEKVGELSFTNVTTGNEHVIHVYTGNEWHGEIVETDEMRPEWFTIDEIPYHKLWPVDRVWFPFVLKDGFLTGEFIYREGEDEPFSIKLNFQKNS